MINRVKNNIEKYKLLEDTETVLAAISGGPDSMAMLYSLYELRQEYGIRILVAHVNHGVRGEFAKRDQDFVQAISNGLGLDYYTTDVDMVAYGKEHKMTSEEAGRLLRYDFFRKILKENGGGRIAIAHNKNDQAETVLHRIIRGTGLDGLRAMTMINGDVIRPLLNIGRDDIESFIEEKGIKTVEDHTNLQTVYTRNKIRLELIPYLRDNFNPNIVDSLYRLSEIAQSDLGVLDQEMEKKYNLIVKKRTNNSIIFKGEAFMEQDEGTARRIIRKALLNLLGNLEGFGEIHIQNAIDLFRSGVTGKSVDLGRDASAIVSYDDLIIRIGKAQSQKMDKTILEIGENRLPGWKLIVSLQEADLISDKGEFSNLHIDRDKVQGNIFIRPREDGDRIKPLGMEGTKKVKDIFIDNKIPREERNNIPIIGDKKGIIWIPGNAISRDYRVDSNTRSILKITIKTIEEEKN
ncbi:tRNA lysidine(34) synthetase TilS [Gudongella sp. DL1XJH-153]|uniref:tRNA lysidine(34) synthetase TilS n=1 Tax=Gudongella sp. DL1XJH-153 TaxID=3409804 RepID=UPI003BB7ECDD